jgi:hypothetical protein
MRSASLQTSAWTAFRCCPSTFGTIVPCSMRPTKMKIAVAGEEAQEILRTSTYYYSFARDSRAVLKEPPARVQLH